MKSLHYRISVIMLLVMAFTVSCSKDVVEEEIPVFEVTFEDVKLIANEFYSLELDLFYERGSVCLSNTPYPPSTPLTIADNKPGTYREIITPEFYSWILASGFKPDKDGKYQYWEMIIISAEDKDAPRIGAATSVDQIINLKDFTRIIYRP